MASDVGLARGLHFRTAASRVHPTCGTNPAVTQHGADNGPLRRYMTLARLVRAFGVSPVVEGRAMDAEHGPAELEVRRRKLLFRAWHRGMRELDLILGRFAD